VESVTARSALLARAGGGTAVARKPAVPPFASAPIYSTAAARTVLASRATPFSRIAVANSLLSGDKGARGEAQKFDPAIPEGAAAPQYSNVSRIWVQKKGSRRDRVCPLGICLDPRGGPLGVEAVRKRYALRLVTFRAQDRA
jgi:hypothetical protein